MANYYVQNGLRNKFDKLLKEQDEISPPAIQIEDEQPEYHMSTIAGIRYMAETPIEKRLENNKKFIESLKTKISMQD
jgi:hypothetical protein